MAEAFKKETDSLGASATIAPTQQNISTLDIQGLTQAIENILNEREKKKEVEAEKTEEKQEEDFTPLNKDLPEGKGDLPEGMASKTNMLLTEDPAMPDYVKAFLGSISKAEGTDRDRSYNIIVGLGTGGTGAPAYFEDYAQHPNIVGMRGKTPEGKKWFSTAAGRFQITNETWNYIQKKYGKEYGLSDFSPPNQEVGAWLLAKERYSFASRKAGEERDLEEDLKNGVTTYMRSYLGPTWAGLKTKFNFEADYNRRLATYRNQTQGVTQYNQEIPKSTNMWDY
jgi:muramidase (phage lysozyme)